jgi:hypothetical protein
MWPCHVYSSVTRRICRVYSLVTSEYTWQGPRGMAQAYSSVNRRIYLGFKTARAPFSFPPLSHFKKPAHAKCPHASVAAAAHAPSQLPLPPPPLRTPRAGLVAPDRRRPRRSRPLAPRACRRPRPPMPPTSGRRSPPPPFLFFEVYLGI